MLQKRVILVKLVQEEHQQTSYFICLPLVGGCEWPLLLIPVSDGQALFSADIAAAV